jgi:membrane-associated phospholipid phosphatase
MLALRVRHDRRHVRRRDAAVCAAALTATGLASTVAGRHPTLDRRLFAAVNHHVDEPRVLRLVQQAGTPWVLPSLAVLAALGGRRRLALAAALALPVEKALEVGIKKARPVPRPLFVEPTVLRDDAPVEGESFPSGHAAIAFAAATLLVPHAAPPVRALVLATATGAAVVRVSQGAHHPVDAAGGAALGVAVGAGLTGAVGR